MVCPRSASPQAFAIAYGVHWNDARRRVHTRREQTKEQLSALEATLKSKQDDVERCRAATLKAEEDVRQAEAAVDEAKYERDAKQAAVEACMAKIAGYKDDARVSEEEKEAEEAKLESLTREVRGVLRAVYPVTSLCATGVVRARACLTQHRLGPSCCMCAIATTQTECPLRSWRTRRTLSSRPRGRRNSLPLLTTLR